MRSKRRSVSPSTILSATDHAKYYSETTIQRSLRFMADPDKKERLEKAECKNCFYIQVGRVGGASVTIQSCGVCGKRMTFSNTCTDVVCCDCGSKWELCKRCGGDLHMRVRRTACPDISPVEEKEDWE